eukprot:CAMPEP_0197026422 /NCGR_PEP_ID=MMETSP1384-20130603/6509_1 /TAXON_ID=29189 /ORGANISM="Ammonia sp." /LENGTH=435 /DNA_ID=CAMNT_0042455077 /DNA_START=23 /DNA_END=1327 /DNA_ORIENTATION=+
MAWNYPNGGMPPNNMPQGMNPNNMQPNQGQGQPSAEEMQQMQQMQQMQMQMAFMNQMQNMTSAMNMQMQAAMAQQQQEQPSGAAPQQPASPRSGRTQQEIDNEINPQVSKDALLKAQMQVGQYKQLAELAKTQSEQLKKEEASLRSDAKYYEIPHILRAFRLDIKEVNDIVDNGFSKQNITDADLKNLDVNDEKLLKKLIPDTKQKKYDEIRRQFAAFVRYDSKRLQLHSVNDDKKQDAAEVVTLNISGYKYTTLKSTLLATKSSYFQMLFRIDLSDQANKHVVDKDGNYFIPRNGRVFEPILRYLQTKQLQIPVNEWYSMKHVFEEMLFYEIRIPDEERDLPESFRFEYCSYYTQTLQFDVRQMRIQPKSEAAMLASKIKEFPGEKTQWMEIEKLMELKEEFVALGYQLQRTEMFRGNPDELWTYVEFYQRVRW